jgi:hypothetical protein
VEQQNSKSKPHYKQTFFDYQQAKIDFKFKQITDDILLIRTYSTLSPYNHITNNHKKTTKTSAAGTSFNSSSEQLLHQPLCTPEKQKIQFKKQIDLKTEISKHYQTVGFGKKPIKCAGTTFKKFCPQKQCDHISLLQGNCKNSICPDCFQDWINTRTKNALKKILTHQQQNLLNNTQKKVAHFTISLDSKYHKLSFKQQEKKAKKILKKHGITGAIQIFHAHRIKKEMKQEITKLAKQHNIKVNGEKTHWKTLRKLQRLKIIKDQYDFIYYSPHFHYIGIYEKYKLATKGQDYIFKKLGGKYTDLFQNDIKQKVKYGTNLIKVLNYQLSHASIHYQNTKNIKYLGALANANISYNQLNTQEQIIIDAQIKTLSDKIKQKEGYGLCPKCNTVLEDISNLHAFIKNYSPQKRKRLTLAYDVYTGRLPPPNEKQINFILNITEG